MLDVEDETPSERRSRVREEITALLHEQGEKGMLSADIYAQIEVSERIKKDKFVSNMLTKMRESGEIFKAENENRWFTTSSIPPAPRLVVTPNADESDYFRGMGFDEAAEHFRSGGTTKPGEYIATLSADMTTPPPGEETINVEFDQDPGEKTIVIDNTEALDYLDEDTDAMDVDDEALENLDKAVQNILAGEPTTEVCGYIDEESETPKHSGSTPEPIDINDWRFPNPKPFPLRTDIGAGSQVDIESLMYKEVEPAVFSIRIELELWEEDLKHADSEDLELLVCALRLAQQIKDKRDSE